jgi:hypothetical protein
MVSYWAVSGTAAAGIVHMTPEEKRKAYHALPSVTKKEMSEMAIFTSFASATGINLDPSTVRNEKPPTPDISCKIDGVPRLFELGEIAGEPLAREIGISQRTQSGW